MTVSGLAEIVYIDHEESGTRIDPWGTSFLTGKKIYNYIKEKQKFSQRLWIDRKYRQEMKCLNQI